ncbi:hypothetical protein [Bythopirellula goksoeyrii]|uniref:hypothetical protein n=1 Tax=Bythopirellula goksoeyrii TaxID=1400387 RepID=UPI001AEF7EB8|nr:hypothetical protein [Bythopirellula goksoeyrii]
MARWRANFDDDHRVLADLPGIEFMSEASFGRSTRWLTCLFSDSKIHDVSPTDVCAAVVCVCPAGQACATETCSEMGQDTIPFFLEKSLPKGRNGWC